MSKKQSYSSKGKDWNKDRSDGDPRDRKPNKRRNDAEKYEDRAGSYVNSYAGKENDPAWYKRNATLVEQAANFSFFNQLGTKLDVLGRPNSSGYDIPESRVAGIARINMVLTPGYSVNTNDPASTAAIGVFEYVRSKLNKPITAYEAQDLFMAIYATDQVYALYNYILRAFGMLDLFSAENFYYPYALLHAGYGWSKDDTMNAIKEVANLRQLFNYYIDKASFLYLPTDFTIVARHSWLFSNYFTDHKTRKGQIYIHKMGGYYKFDETSYDTGTACKYYPLGSESLPELINIFAECVEALRNSTSYRVMVSDMRQAFSDRGQWKLAYLDERYTVGPTYSEEVLEQIENSKIFGVWGDKTNFELAENSKDIRQNPNTNSVIFAPRITGEAWNNISDAQYGTDDAISEYYYLLADDIMNVHWDNPSLDDVLVSTRNKFAVANNGLVDGIGSDLITYIQIYLNPDVEDWHNDGSTAIRLYGYISGSTYPTFNQFLTAIAAWAIFDWVPMLYLGNNNNGELSLKPLLEFDNYTTVDYKSIKRLHTAVINSMWSIPQMGTYEASTK